MDGALQASIGLITPTGNNGQLSLPFALQELEIWGKNAERMWAYLRTSEGSGDKVQKLDIGISDETGKITARIKGYASRVLELGKATADSGMMMLEPVWQAKPVGPKAAPVYEHHLVVLCEMGEESAAVIGTEMGARCINLQTKSKGLDKRFQGYAVQLFEEIRKLMLEKQTGKAFVQLAVASQAEQGVFAGLSCLLKTAQLENPKLMGQLIEVAAGEDTAGLIAKLKENSISLDSHIRYQSGEREVAGWQEAKLDQAAGSPWRAGGIYLITGAPEVWG